MSVQINEYTVYSKEINDVGFLFLSDLHDCSNEPLLKAVSSSKVDAVLVGGDFIHDHFFSERGFEFLSQASKILPVFCSLGNHEAGYWGDIRKKVIKTGATLLDNDFINFKGVNIGGLTSGYFYSINQSNTDFLTEYSQIKGYKLLLCHHPEYYAKYIKDLPIDLILSGHAHGGQWRLFGRGFFAPGQGILPKYTSGIYDNRLIVSRGLGNPTFVPKINNQPEILKINIKKSDLFSID